MPRACVIVLDAVGAGALPDAAEYGKDEAIADTLGNVSRAVGGLDLPNLEALGLGNVEPLEGCPPQAGAPAIAGRLVERSKGKDTTTGHWELMGVVTPQPFPTYPHGFPHDVIDPFMHRTGRGVLGNKAASGTEIIQELGEEHQRTGKWIVYTSADSVFQIAAHEETIPLEELYDGVQDRARDPHGQARGRSRDRAAVHRRAGELHAHAEPARLLGRAAHAELPDAAAGRRGRGARRRQDRRHLRGRRDRRVASDEVERRGDQRDDAPAARARRRDVRLRQPRRDGHALGTPQRPGELPPLPAGLRPPADGHPRRAASGRPARAHLRPRLRPDDARAPTTRASTRCCSRTSRDETRTGTFTRRASSPTSARPSTRGSAARRRRGAIPGRSIVDAVSLRRPAAVRARVRRPRRDSLARRAVVRIRGGPGSRRELAFEAVAEVRPRRVPRGRLRAGRARGARCSSQLGAEVVAVDVSPRMVELARDARRRRARGRRPGAAVRRRRVRLRRRRVDALPRARPRPRRSPSSRASLRPGGRLVAVTNGDRPPGRAARVCVVGHHGPRTTVQRARTAQTLLELALRSASSGATPTGTDHVRRTRRRRASRTSRRRSRSSTRGRRRCRTSTLPLVVRRAPARLRRDGDPSRRADRAQARRRRA